MTDINEIIDLCKKRDEFIASLDGHVSIHETRMQWHEYINPKQGETKTYDCFEEGRKAL